MSALYKKVSLSKVTCSKSVYNLYLMFTFGYFSSRVEDDKVSGNCRVSLSNFYRGVMQGFHGEFLQKSLHFSYFSQKLWSVIAL